MSDRNEPATFMTRQQFCDGIRLLGGKAAAATVLDMQPRTIERIMSGKSDLGEGLAADLARALRERYLDIYAWANATGYDWQLP